jgi:hypothetical protein
MRLPRPTSFYVRPTYSCITLHLPKLSLVAEDEYLVSDPVAEKKWNFKFSESIERSKGPDGGSNLFNQMTFYVTPKVSVDIKLLKNVVSAGGGQVSTGNSGATLFRC